MKKIVLILLLASISTFSNAQAKFFSPQGKRLYFGKVTIIGKIAETFGPATQTAFFNTEKDLYLAFYTPLSHIPFAFQCKDSLTAIRLVSVFATKEKYLGTSAFDMDFKKLKDKFQANTEFIINLLGKPDREESTAPHPGVTSFFYDKYHFALYFDNGLLESYKILK